MIRRTTIELDDELLARAKRALSAPTTRATVEEALRRVADAAEHVQAERTDRQVDFLRRLPTHIDLEIYESEEMWH
jgi:Arc/MetJ family transcription regulator